MDETLKKAPLIQRYRDDVREGIRMGTEQITSFLQEHWYLVALAVGVVMLIGAIINWSWLCAPVGKPNSHRYGRSSRRALLAAGNCTGYCGNMGRYINAQIRRVRHDS